METEKVWHAAGRVRTCAPRRESDFKSDALTTRPRLPVPKPPAHPTITCQYRTNSQLIQKILSEVGFEPTPTEVDCDLNAAP